MTQTYYVVDGIIFTSREDAINYKNDRQAVLVEKGVEITPPFSPYGNIVFLMSVQLS